MADRAVLFWLLFLTAVGVFVWRSWRLLRPLQLGPPDPRFDNSRTRLKGVLQAIGFHQRLFKIRYAGTLHALIFISFLVLATAIIETFGSGLIPGFTLAPLGGNTWIAFLQDMFGLVMLAGVGMACWQRYVRRPQRFVGSKRGDATIIYVLIVGSPHLRPVINDRTTGQRRMNPAPS